MIILMTVSLLVEETALLVVGISQNSSVRSLTGMPKIIFFSLVLRVCASIARNGSFPKLGYHFGGPYNKE